MSGFDDFYRIMFKHGFTSLDIAEAFSSISWNLYPFGMEKGRRDIPSPSMFRKDNSEVRDIG